MRFNNIAYVIYNTYNDFGELEQESESRLKCLVLKHKKKNDFAEDEFGYKHDLKLMIAYKSFAPYSDMFNSDMLKIKYEDKEYMIKIITAINNFNGKTKYFEIDCDEDVNG